MKKFKKKIYLGLVVGVSMFGFMAHTKQVTADTNQKERIMSQLDDSQIEYVPNELIVSLKAIQRISTEKNKPQNLLGVKGFCCKVFQKIYFSVKLRKKTERTE
ncbi:hypothetical protein [Enterococcus lactis]|uniref:hypothetical protein n=1 Tax=Enterococcus lactis TaxID=357441 RepID=UPI003F747354